jgi:hypothetical protein
LESTEAISRPERLLPSMPFEGSVAMTRKVPEMGRSRLGFSAARDGDCVVARSPRRKPGPSASVLRSRRGVPKPTAGGHYPLRAASFAPTWAFSQTQTYDNASIASVSSTRFRDASLISQERQSFGSALEP